MQITITLNFEEATILAYATRRGFVQNEEGTLNPMDFLKEYWKQYIITNINEYIEDAVWAEAQVQADALKEDAKTKITIE